MASKEDDMIRIDNSQGDGGSEQEGKDNNTSGGGKKANLKKARKRLSVVSDNELIEGFQKFEIDEENAPAVAAPPVEEFIIASYAGLSKKGFAPYNPRKRNQDTLVMAEHAESRSLLLAVFDGHGEAGDLISGYYKRECADLIFNHPAFLNNLQTAIREVILELESRVIQDRNIDTDFSGTTMVLTVIRDDVITAANVGDSRVVIGCANPTGEAGSSSTSSPPLIAEALTIDHKPDVPAEKERIVNAGGRVFAVEYDDGVDGPPRVWLGHMDVPGLAMSRSLGDTVAHTAGVISEPEFFVKRLDGARDMLLLIATDGLWEFVTDQEAVEMAARSLEPRLAVDALISDANQRWLKEEQVIDDTTVCVAFLRGWNPPNAGNASTSAAGSASGSESAKESGGSGGGSSGAEGGGTGGRSSGEGGK